MFGTGNAGAIELRIASFFVRLSGCRDCAHGVCPGGGTDRPGIPGLFDEGVAAIWQNDVSASMSSLSGMSILARGRGPISAQSEPAAGMAAELADHDS